MQPPTFDKLGRMKYHPLYHPNNGKFWTTIERKYILKWYYVDGPEKVSIALGRTIISVMNMAKRLVDEGSMPKRPKGTKNQRRLMRTF